LARKAKNPIKKTKVLNESQEVKTLKGNLIFKHIIRDKFED